MKIEIIKGAYYIRKNDGSLASHEPTKRAYSFLSYTGAVHFMKDLKDRGVLAAVASDNFDMMSSGY